MIVFLSFITLLCAGVFLIGGLYADDIQTIRQHRAAKKHPYASWRRKRPPATIYIIGVGAQEQAITIASIQKLRQKNISVAASPYAPFILPTMPAIILPAGEILTQTQYAQIVRSMNFRHSNTYFAAPRLRTMEVITHVFFNYRAIHTALVSRAKNGILTVFPRVPSAPTVLYAFEAATRLFVSLAIVYATYLVIIAEQAMFLLMLVIVGIVYITTAISMHPQLHTVEKIYYCALSPISYAYFYFISLVGVAAIFSQLIMARVVYLSKFWRI